MRPSIDGSIDVDGSDSYGDIAAQRRLLLSCGVWLADWVLSRSCILSKQLKKYGNSCYGMRIRNRTQAHKDRNDMWPTAAFSRYMP